MRLLLDTHIILWGTAEPERLPRGIVDELRHPDTELWFSPISVWEILVLGQKGRVLLKGDPLKVVRRIFQQAPFKEAPLNREVAIQSRHPDLLPHQDPADRFLAATALVYHLTLLTADKRIIQAQTVPILSAT